MKQKIAEAVAQAWCTKENEGKVMDPDLASAIIDNVMKVLEPKASSCAPIKEVILAIVELGPESKDPIRPMLEAKFGASAVQELCNQSLIQLLGSLTLSDIFDIQERVRKHEDDQAA